MLSFRKTLLQSTNTIDSQKGSLLLNSFADLQHVLKCKASASGNEVPSGHSFDRDKMSRKIEFLFALIHLKVPILPTTEKGNKKCMITQRNYELAI
jgi:hypothetical protein